MWRILAMKQWNGLMRKEWSTIRMPLMVGVIFLFIGFLLVIVGFGNIAKEQVNLFEASIAFSFFWYFFSTFIPTIVLLILVEKDVKQSDVWLHTPASATKLIGTKAVYAAVIGLIAYAIPSFLNFCFYFFEQPPIRLSELLLIGVIVVTAMYIASLGTMGSVFFMWVLYRLMKPYVKAFAIPLTLSIAVIWTIFHAAFMMSSFYEKYIAVWPIDLSFLKNLQYESFSFHFTAQQSTLFLGSIIFEMTLWLFFIIIGLRLFESKVRL